MLALGSHFASEEPRPGFSRRIKAQIQAEARPSPVGWLEAIGLVARPALGFSACAMLLSVALYSAAPDLADKHDLAMLAEREPIIGSLLSNRMIGLLTPPEQPR